MKKLKYVLESEDKTLNLDQFVNLTQNPCAIRYILTFIKNDHSKILYEIIKKKQYGM